MKSKTKPIEQLKINNNKIHQIVKALKKYNGGRIFDKRVDLFMYAAGRKKKVLFRRSIENGRKKAKKPVDHPCRQLELPATKVIYRSADLTVTACPVTGLDRSLDR